MDRKGYVKSSDQVKLYYLIVGEGRDPLVLINGGPGLSHTELRELRYLSKYATLIYYDQRGTGKSKKISPEHYTVEANVQDLENLRKGLGLGTISILGFAWGASIALMYALTFPSNVRKLILVGEYSSATDIAKVFQSMRDNAPKHAQEIFEKYERLGLYSAGEKYPEEYLAAVQPTYNPYTIGPLVPNYLMKVFDDLNWDVYRALWGEESEFKITGALRNYDVRSRLKEIKVPVLMIYGANDLVPIEFAKRDAAQIPNSRLVVLEDAKHFCFIDQPKEFEKVVRDFLARKD
jgi:proline iminopeptidase